LLDFETKISHLHAICGISEVKSQIWGAKNANLDGLCNILVFTHVPMVFNDVWMLLMDLLMIFSDFSMVSIFC